MKFYDARLRYGRHINTSGPFLPCETMGELVDNMRNCGMSGGVVYSYEADTVGVVIGNKRLENDIKTYAESAPDISLFGAYTIVPSCTGEIPPPDELPGYMLENGFRCIRFHPAKHRFMPSGHVIGDYLQMASEKKIPVLLDTCDCICADSGLLPQQADYLLRDFPNLTCILSYQHCWPNERMVRPFLRQYKNLHLNTAHYIADGVYEQFDEMFGGDRLIFGSGFPSLYMSANMLMVKHAEISDESKKKCAGENLIRLVGGFAA